MASHVIHGAAVLAFLDEWLALISIQYPIDGFWEKTDPVAAQMNVGFFSWKQKKVFSGNPLALLVHNL